MSSVRTIRPVEKMSRIESRGKVAISYLDEF